MRLLLMLILMLKVAGSLAQPAYKKGDVISNFNAPVILNGAVASSSFNQLKKTISIIDFFGTWCIPCVKALPLLEALQKKHPNIQVLLLSVEKKADLEQFLMARKTLTLPIIADADNSISNLFKPPSYPYTVVINGNNQVISITEASAITDEKIMEWMQATAIQKETTVISTQTDTTKQTTLTTTTQNPVNELASQFIYAAKTGNATAAVESSLQSLSFSSLQNSLNSDDEKKAFWINIYNGYTQLLLKKDPEKYKNRNRFFKAKQILIAGKMFSLDEIEHDILRRTKIKWSLGYLNKLFPSKKAKTLRVEHLDYRIHFALNCGAKSCPPIAFYDPANLPAQLDIATNAYLSGEATYNEAKNSLKLPAIMGWFRHDFKGKKNMLALVKKYNVVPNDKNPKISFKKYDWNLYLNNYKN